MEKIDNGDPIPDEIILPLLEKELLRTEC